MENRRGRSRFYPQVILIFPPVCSSCYQIGVEVLYMGICSREALPQRMETPEESATKDLRNIQDSLPRC